jgi:hypothetical protein
MLQERVTIDQTQRFTDIVSDTLNNPDVVSRLLTDFAIALAGLSLVLLLYSRWQLRKKVKALSLEKHKCKEIEKKLKLALSTIQKMETNPDLVHSRDSNLDYLQMRMDEEVFRSVIVNQIKIKVKQLIAQDLRADPKKGTTVGLASTSGHKVDKTFDVTYEIKTNGRWRTNIFFRVQIKLTKLTIHSSSSILHEIIACIENYFSPDESQDNWTPTINGKVVVVSWDRCAKPIPLLVLEQVEEGNMILKKRPMEL